MKLVPNILIGLSALGIYHSALANTCDETQSLCWVTVLIAQNEPPSIPNPDTRTNSNPQYVHIVDPKYINAIHQLAPNLKEFHIMVEGDTDPNVIATTIQALKQKYGDTLQIGYQPDFYKDKGNYTKWGCDAYKEITKLDDWLPLNTCMTQKAIDKLNAITNLNTVTTIKGLKPVHFDFFTLEQSYIYSGHHHDPKYEVPAQGALFNGCFNHNASTPCPAGITKTTHSLKIGNILGYGSGDDSTIYDANQLQNGYPQLYNLVNRTASTDPEKNNASFRTYAGGFNGMLKTVPSSNATPLVIVDACISAGACQKVTSYNGVTYTTAPTASRIAGLTLNDAYAYGEPNIAAGYLAWAAAPSIAKQVPTSTAPVTWMLSGEPYFLGAINASSTGCLFSLPQINNFVKKFKDSLSTACTAQGMSCSGQNLQLGIWNFSNLLSYNKCGGQ